MYSRNSTTIETRTVRPPCSRMLDTAMSSADRYAFVGGQVSVSRDGLSLFRADIPVLVR